MAAEFSSEAADVVVVGAGPAGMSAATRAARAGLKTVLLDEQNATGGQIYRAIGRASARRKEILGSDYTAGAAIANAFAASGARLVTNASVWQVTRERSIHYLKDGKVGCFDAQRVILASGALERPFPIPGWTLPGVLTAGAAQILLKSAGEVPAAAPVLAGCGPLLYLLGWQYVRAGVPIRALVDTTRNEDRWRAKHHMLSALRAWPFISKGLQLIRTLRDAGVPMFEAADEDRTSGLTAGLAHSRCPSPQTPPIRPPRVRTAPAFGRPADKRRWIEQRSTGGLRPPTTDPCQPSKPKQTDTGACNRTPCRWTALTISCTTVLPNPQLDNRSISRSAVNF